MHSKNDRPASGQILSTRALQAAYSHYGSVMAVSSGDNRSAQGIKRVFTAALLSTASFIATSAVMTNDASASCTGRVSFAIHCSGDNDHLEFSYGSTTVVYMDEGSTIDTTSAYAAHEGDGTGVHLYVSEGSANILNQGDIKSGSENGEIGNHGIHSQANDNAAASNERDATIHTYNDLSDGLFSESDTLGRAIANNRGNIHTYGAQSDGMHASAYNGSAYVTNIDVAHIIVTGDGSDGMVAIAGSEGNHAYARNYGSITASGETEDGFTISGWLDESGPDITDSNAIDHVVVGVAAIGHYANAGSYAGGSITMTGSGSIGVVSRAVNYAVSFNSGSIISGDSDEDAYNFGVVAFTEADGNTAMASNAGTVQVFGEHSVGVFAYGEGDAHAVARNYTGASITTGSASEDGAFGAVGLLAMGLYDAYAINGTGESEDGPAQIVTWGDGGTGVAAISFVGGQPTGFSEDGSVSGRKGGATAINTVNGSVVTHGDNATGVMASSAIEKYAHAVNAGTIETYGNYSIGLAATGGLADSASGLIFNPLSDSGIGSPQPFNGEDGNLIIAENSGDIITHGDRAIGVVAASKYAQTTINNLGTVTTYGEDGYGLAALSKYGDIDITNAQGASILTHGDSASGIVVLGVKYAGSEDGTVNITNAGTITTSGAGASGIIAIGAGTVSVTNTETGVISVSRETIAPDSIFPPGAAIAVLAGKYSEGGGDAIVSNAGQITGHVYAISKYSTELTNTGSIDGNVVAASMYGHTSLLNEGGTVTGSIRLYGNADVIVSGTGNSIGKGIHANSGIGPSSIELESCDCSYSSTLAFSQTDTMIFADGVDGFAIDGFSTVSFNNGTTIFDSSDSEDGVNIALVDGYVGPVSIHPDTPPPTVPSTINVGGVNAATLGFTGNNPISVYSSMTNVLNHGTLSVAAGSSVVFSGDVAFSNGSRFTVGLGAGGEHGLLQASTIDFAEGSYVNVDVSSGIDLTNGARTVVAVGDGTGSVTIADGVGTNGMRVTDNSILFNFLTAQNATASDLELVTQRSLSIEQLEIDTQGGTNKEAVGAALDIFLQNLPNDNPIVIYLSQFPTPEAQQAALLQLVQDTIPDESGSLTQGTIATTDLVFDLIMDRLSGGGPTVASNENGRTGMSAGDIELGGEGNWAIWGRAGASRSEFTPSAVNGFDANIWGITLGIDGGLADNIRGGVAFFHQNAQISENGAGANGGEDIKGNGGIAYMTWRPAPWYLNGSVGFSGNSYDSRRASLGALNTASFDGTQYVARLELGRDFAQGPWKFTPNVGLRYSHVKTDGYTEAGPLPLTVQGSTVNSVRGVAGLNVSYRSELESGAVLIPEASIEVINEFANPGKAITATVIGGGTFVTTPISRKDLAFGAAAGVTYEASRDVSVRLMYKGEYGKDYIDNGVQLAVRFAF